MLREERGKQKAQRGEGPRAMEVGGINVAACPCAVPTLLITAGGGGWGEGSPFTKSAKILGEVPCYATIGFPVKCTLFSFHPYLLRLIEYCWEVGENYRGM